jgi:predicted HNH restriction endonuclease
MASPNLSFFSMFRTITGRGGSAGKCKFGRWGNRHQSTSNTLGREECPHPAPTDIETRKYAFHRKIERNRTAAKQAKKFHGTRCQACDLDFAERYGAIGKGFIEAHHLKPIATLEEGMAVTYDVAADFAVLCANCHRMIHRCDDPSNLSLFRENLASPDT